MQISQLLDMPKLKQQIADGFISSRPHPRLPLAVLNYAQKATFTVAPQDWDENLHLCRGLIYNTETQEIVARSFRKFWGYLDDRVGTVPEMLPAHAPEITTKLDGSLGVYYEYDGQAGVSTRGSFESEQAIWATKWFMKHLRKPPRWLSDWSPLFEIVFTSNKIVVDYDTEGLFLIGAVHKTTGEEMTRPNLRHLAATLHCPLVDFHEKTPDQCVGEDAENFEGYVATWHVGKRPPIKVKIKLPEYKRLAKLYSGVSPKEIWRMMSENESFEELIGNAPQPYVDWVDSWRGKLVKAYNSLSIRAEHVYFFRPMFDGDERQHRKACALYFSKTPEFMPILFATLDGDEKKRTAVTWKLIKELATGRPVFKPEAVDA